MKRGRKVISVDEEQTEAKTRSSRKKTKASTKASKEDAAIVDNPNKPSPNHHPSASSLYGISEEELERICKLENIGEYEERFHHLDQQILELEAERQSILKVLKIHPSTRVTYSTINRFEKTKEGLQNTKFHKLAADCLGLIFNFMFHQEVVEWSVIKSLTELSTNIRDAIHQYSSCILGLCKITKLAKNTTPPPFQALTGVEIVASSICNAATDALLKTNPNLTQLIIREDLDKTTLTSFSTSILDKIDTLICYGSHSKASSLSLDEFVNVKKYCYIAYKKIPHSRPPNAVQIVYGYPMCQGSLDTLDGIPDSVETLTICIPNCPQAGGNVNYDTASYYIEHKKNLKSFRYFGFSSKTKRPDIQGSHLFESKLCTLEKLKQDEIASVYNPKLSKATCAQSFFFNSVPAQLFHNLRHEFDFNASKFDVADLPKKYQEFVATRICK
ncbi:hypothetical protein C9374_002552 [Naegleria lovaniensis]|uniref:Uncharacterized protein n=1 Tax=Naegleria lovaniensis TaxID=51637 RepID=A0AA88GUM3_NAELO|nr:uncharacterized protein C9374_002552 [Naegleria lovaniensis]KAG2386106.1 hypothetical protein C9374_002552 [Naegleria lovaniensis]